MRGGARQAKAKASEEMATDLGRQARFGLSRGGPRVPHSAPPPSLRENGALGASSANWFSHFVH